MESPFPLNREEIFKIYDQMGKSVCQIVDNKNGGTAFFCNIPFKNEKQYLPVLVTGDYIINEDMIKENKVICISLFDKKEIRNIELNNRLIYTNKEYNITLIEIKPNVDKISNFLELDENIFKQNKEYLFNKESIYVLQYPEGKCSSVSFGIIKKINNNKIIHNCWTSYGSGGAPLLSMKTFKVIGLHIGKNKNINYNIGILLDHPINEFQKKV